jgi:SAM-dependent methyltransferase
MEAGTSETRTDRYDAIWRGWAGQAPPDVRITQHQQDRAAWLSALAHAAAAAPVPRVLEVGCGSAIDLCLLATGAPRRSFAGLDISRPALEAAEGFARHLGVRAALVCGDATVLPVRDASLGLVFSQGLLEHFRNARVVLREQIRALAPGGWLVVSVPQTVTGYTLHKRAAMRRGAWPWGWEGQFTARQLARLGRELGLEVARVFGYHYWRSWSEPAWILRDLWGKIQRRNPLAALPPFPQITRGYEALWQRLERRWGHLFLQNVVAVFRKPIDKP